MTDILQSKGLLKGLQITPEFALPPDADARRLALLGMSGAGKTSAAKVMVERLFHAGRRLAILDPNGVWWGLKTSRDGASAGLPVVIFGGRHADVPLEPGAGAAVADLIMEQAVSVILDLSGFEDDLSACRVAGDFVRRVRYLQNPEREPLLLVADEADLLAPQNGGDKHPSGPALVGVARRSRSDGLGLFVITQRPVGISTDILNQAEAVFLMRFGGYNDLARVEAWIGAYLSKAERDEVVAALPSLAAGECFVTSPSWMRTFQRVQFPLPETFDSSATPRAGDRRVARARADVDVAALAERFAAAIAHEQESDPDALRQRIAALERLLKDRSAEVETKTEYVEVPVLTDVQAGQMRGLADALTGNSKDLWAIASEILRGVDQTVARAEGAVAPNPDKVAQDKAAQDRGLGEQAKGAAEGDGGGVKMSQAERKILTALAQYSHQYPQGRAKEQLALLTGYSAGGGGFGNALSSLRTRGWVTGAKDGPPRITDAGRAALGSWEPLPTGRALIDYWLARLGKAERAVLQALVAAHPDALTKQEVAGRAGYEASGGGFNNALGKLRTLELITRGAEIRASAVFFE